MPTDCTAGKSTTRRYSSEEKRAAVRMVRSLQAETGLSHWAVKRVASQLGYGVESVRSWVERADVDDGVASGVTTAENARMRELEQEVREPSKRCASCVARTRSSGARRLSSGRSSTASSADSGVHRRQQGTTWSTAGGSGSSPSARCCSWLRAATTPLATGLRTARHRDLLANQASNTMTHINPVLRRPVEFGQFTSIRYGERLAEIGATPSIGTVGDSLDNALAETVNGYYKTELIRGPARTGPWKTIEEVELATLGWVHWHNTQRLHGYLHDLPPAEFETKFYVTHQGDKTLA
jgi:transposase-like protein